MVVGAIGKFVDIHEEQTQLAHLRELAAKGDMACLPSN